MLKPVVALSGDVVDIAPEAVIVQHAGSQQLGQSAPRSDLDIAGEVGRAPVCTVDWVVTGKAGRMCPCAAPPEARHSGARCPRVHVRYDRSPVASMDELHTEIRTLRQRVAELEAAAEQWRRLEIVVGESEGKLRALLESASQGIVVIDGNGEVVLVNARLEAMFGYRREELLGQKLEVLVPTELRGGHVAHRTRYAADPQVRPMGVGHRRCHRETKSRT